MIQLQESEDIVLYIDIFFAVAMILFYVGYILGRTHDTKGVEYGA